ncbi:hypothetical protein D3C80_1982670 [compost metagenome]
MEGDVVTMQEIFAFTQTGVGKGGEVQGYFHATGVRPKFADRFQGLGIVLPETVFDPERHYQ